MLLLTIFSHIPSSSYMCGYVNCSQVMWQFIQHSWQWLLGQLGALDPSEVTPSAPPLVPTTASRPPRTKLLHTMFHVGHRPFDQVRWPTEINFSLCFCWMFHHTGLLFEWALFILTKSLIQICSWANSCWRNFLVYESSRFIVSITKVSLRTLS
jgi:hypothetical protein